MNFDAAFTRLLGHEGGYSNNPNDPGGETNWGISKRTYPHLNIATLTQQDAKDIYKRDFWDKAKCQYLPAAVRFDLFDGAVNSSPEQAIKWLQRAVHVDDDGKVGPITIKACSVLPASVITSRYNGQRLLFMTERKTWAVFGRGWARRIANNLLEA